MSLIPEGFVLDCHHLDMIDLYDKYSRQCPAWPNRPKQSYLDFLLRHGAILKPKHE